MNPTVRVTAFGAALLAVFALAFAAGRGLGPFDSGRPADSDTAASAAGDVPGGLMVSADGYALALDQPSTTLGDAVPVSFRIVGPNGKATTEFDIVHDKRLHFIAVRRDMTGFQHVHPTLADDGTWSTELALQPGDWRLFADFKPTAGETLILGADLAVPGDYQPNTRWTTTRTSRIDGYEVTLGGKLRAETDSKLTLTVSKDGKPVTDLQPYLGAFGHLVALRAGDLAYLHVHPGEENASPGPKIAFIAEVPSAGRYRLFLDFKHGGVVRTASFALTAEAAGAASENSPPIEMGHGGH